jgi:uridine phosphorylase
MSRILPITGLEVGSVSTAVLVCGDPDRATKIATHLEQAALISEQREYRAYRGQFDGCRITVCAHGIGSPGAAIAFEELIAAGARYIIRVGTCGGLQPDIVSGSLVIVTAAVQNTGYGRQTVPAGYPAVADLTLASALCQTALAQNLSYRSGIVLTSDTFYRGVQTVDTPDYQQLSAANVLAVEMECAALFLVGSLRSVQTAAILVADGNVLQAAESMDTYNPHQQVVDEAIESAIQSALAALRDNY